MIKYHHLLILLLTLFVLQCNKYTLRKYDIMISGDIIPEVIWAGSILTKCLNYDKDTLIFTSPEGYAMMCIFNDDLSEVIEKKSIKFPLPCFKYMSFPGTPFVIGYGYRDLNIINFQTQSVNSKMLSYSGNDKIVQARIIDKKSMDLFITMVHCSFKKDTYKTFIYNLYDDTITDKSITFPGELFLLKDETLLLEHLSKQSNIWSISTNLKYPDSQNQLTQKLSETGLLAWNTSFSEKINLLIGKTKINNQRHLFTVRWNDNYENVKIEPMTFQVPEDRFISDYFEISPDGKWAKSVIDNSNTERIYNTVFFRIDEKFPQSLSIPVQGSKSMLDSRGCFMESEKWGTLYVDVSEHFPGHVLVYKMSDVQNKIIEKMRNMAR